MKLLVAHISPENKPMATTRLETNKKIMSKIKTFRLNCPKKKRAKKKKKEAISYVVLVKLGDGV